MMDAKWMVYDTSSGDVIFHETEEKAQEDYDSTVKGVVEDELLGEHKVYIFKVVKSTTCVFYPED